MRSSDHPEAIGRQVKTSGAAIVGVVSCVPKNKIQNSSFFDVFGETSVNDVVRMIGVQQRHIAEEAITTRDLCSVAGKKLLEGLEWSADSVDVLIFVSQTPEFILPATACTLHSDLNLSKATIAFDINLGCSGFPYAVWLGMTMVQSGAAKRVLLAVGDTISKIVDPNDRSTALLFGDAGTMTAIEASPAGEAFFVLGTDGAGAANLIVPSGAFKDYSKSGDLRLTEKAPECLYMDGGEIFNFTLRALPALVKSLSDVSGLRTDAYDYYLFHQANLFMLKHLAKKLKLSSEKMPINIDEYGNTSCASIPLLMTTRLKDALGGESLQISMFGFGVGYSWGAASLRIGPMKFISAIEL
uniref:ketoacyl-ACP synthase III n=1 Tax=Polynucleobacter sp. TaxID=2029855 RepID=UPI00404894D7